jgi:pimeloyl-ACP methyl ester carboxylesterase
MKNRQPTVVLVHGAWGSPEMWDFVMDELPPETEIAVADLPTNNRAGTTLLDDAAHVRELVGDRPAILVGHSYGGAVITEAAAAIPAQHLLYLAACMPDVGETMLEWVMKRPFPDPTPMEVFDDGTSVLSLDPENLPYDELTSARLRDVRLRRFALAGVTTPVGAAAWSTTPSTYVVTAQDTMIHPETQREMARRAAAVMEIDADHQVILSHPEYVAAVITSLLSV